MYTSRKSDLSHLSGKLPSKNFVDSSELRNLLIFCHKRICDESYLPFAVAMVLLEGMSINREI